MDAKRLSKGNIYDVESYSDRELYDILELDNPTDRVLEAKILSMVNKYTRMSGNKSADMLAQFFIDIYARFFDVKEEDGDGNGDGDEFWEYEDPEESAKEGFTTQPDMSSYDKSVNSADRFVDVADITDSDPTYGPMKDKPTAINSKYQMNDYVGDTAFTDVNGDVVAKNTTPEVKRTYAQKKVERAGVLDIEKNDRGKDNTQLTKPIDYAKDTLNLNPILKQTIKRVISIDSQYRDNNNSPSTEFTFNLSEPLRDVLSLKLYSVQIPYTWYTINSSFGGNFFYIKGDAEGINNGDHDYKVQIKSGAYNAAEIQSAMQASILGLRTTYPDVSFGETGISYDATSVRMTLVIDIKESFGETNYYIEFPNWSSPNNTITRLDTLAGYLGYNDVLYNCGSVYSSRKLIQNVSTDEYAIRSGDGNTPANNVIQIITYMGTKDITYVNDIPTTDFYDVSREIDTYTITIPPRNYSLTSLLAAINQQFAAADFLDTAHSYIRKVDINNSLMLNSGESYIQLNVKIKRKDLKNIDNIKTIVKFPADTTIWIGNNSLLKFKQQINEISNVEAETALVQSRYLIRNTTTEKNQLRFICITNEYVNGTNDFVVELNSSTSTNNSGYTLDEYINEVNGAIQRKNNTYTYNPIFTANSDTNRTFLRKTANRYLELQLFVRKIFTNVDYYISFNGLKLVQLFAFTQADINLSEQDRIIRNSLNAITSITFDLSVKSSFAVSVLDPFFLFETDNITITPKIQYGGYPLPYVLKPVNSLSNTNTNETEIFEQASDISERLNSRIVSFLDGQGKNPFLSPTLNTSALLNSDNAGFVFNVYITKILTSSDYKLVLYSNQGASSQNVQNTWSSYFGFNGTSGVADITIPEQEYTNFGSSILNTIQISDNLITLNETNNYFYIKPYSDVNGLQTTNGLYNIKITMPLEETEYGNLKVYSVDDIYASINAQFAANHNTIGSYIYKTSDNRTSFRMNINRVFRTPDYRLVFYDPYSFVSCYSGATRAGNKSVQNATWDTTIGWILGFRDKIIYYLNEYDYDPAPLDSNSLNYYKDASRYKCVMIGDTTVSTNIYNYFLIVLDDYTQNHLNDGLVTITKQETAIDVGKYTYVCDPYATTGSTMIAVPADKAHDGSYKQMSQRELYTFNQKVLSKKVKEKSYSKGPFVKDIFGILPLKLNSPGTPYVEFGGTLQNQERLYFGPVNIHRMTIRLLNDRGDLVDLNNTNWSFSLVCEQLYRNKL
jgi:hypothetical protein